MGFGFGCLSLLVENGKFWKIEHMNLCKIDTKLLTFGIVLIGWFYGLKIWTMAGIWNMKFCIAWKCEILQTF